jgi:hypothetical protein
MRTRLVVLALFGGVVAPALVAAQSPRPLDKMELIRLLTNPLFAQTEVADVVRRSCVGFRPTERDWADLRSAGAGGEVIASVASCTTPRTAPAVVPLSAPIAPLTAVAVTPEVIATAGSPASVRVFVHRGGAPQRRVTVLLRGTTALGLQRDALAITNDSGMAVFPLPPLSHPSSHRFEILGSSGATFPGRPNVTFVVRAGQPARVRVTPEYIASAERPVTIFVAVADSLGNSLRGEPVELSSGVGEPLSATTDSLGRVAFALQPSALPRGGALHLRVRALPVVDVPVADAAGLSGVATGFAGGGTRRGRVGSALSDALIFKARTVQGAAPAGRVVRFRAVNARVSPDSVAIDSTGRVSLDVELGTRAGEALVFATIDSVEKLVTVQVDPGPLSSLVMEFNGQNVTGQKVMVPVNTPFVLRVTARDPYGNETLIDALAQMLRAQRTQLAARQRNLQLLTLEPGESVVLITLKAQRLGTFDFTVGSGITASVRVEAVAR